MAILLLAVIGAGDYYTGTEYNFSLFYFIPVALTSWTISRRAGYYAALSSAIVWTIVDYFGRLSLTIWLLTWNILFQFVLFIVFATIISQIREMIIEYRRVNSELHRALTKVKQPSGLIPTCSWYKRIRGEDGEWHQMEEYIASHSEANFSHGICPSCASKNFRRIASAL
jgi:K+-sensing histidine kinase KdpD